MNAERLMVGTWVVRLVDGEVDRGIVDVVVHVDRFELRSSSPGEEAPVVVLRREIASVAQEWAGLSGRVLVRRRGGGDLVLDHGVLPAGELFAAIVAAAGGPNTVRPE